MDAGKAPIPDATGTDASSSPDNKPSAGIIAAIDVGSGALRMEIAEVSPSVKSDAGDNKRSPVGYKILDSLRMPVMLGRDSYTEGQISQSTIRDCIRTLNGFQRLIKEYKADSVCAVATSALREAQNRDFILDQIRVKTGLDVEILDNAVERHLALLGLESDNGDPDAQSYKKMRREGMVIVDVGYGSSQVSAIRGGEMALSRNVRLGTMRMWEMLTTMSDSALHFADMMEEYIIANMDHIRAMVRWQDIPHCMLLSGEADELIRAAGGRITRKRFNQLYIDMKRGAGVELNGNGMMSQEHIETLLPTMMITKAFLDMTGAEALHVSNASLTNGLLKMLACKYAGAIVPSAENDSISLARAIARSQFYDEKHSGYVERKALDLFDALAPVHALGERERFLLRLACIMHDAGKSIASPQHGNISASIVRSSHLIGLTATELETVAQVCQHHSAASDLPSLADKLEARQYVTVAKLASILRLADALDKGHQQKFDKIDVSIKDNKIILKTKCARDAMMEKWFFQRRAGYFKQVFGREVVLKVAQTNEQDKAGEVK